MASKKKNDPLSMLQLDIQYRDRQLAAELAMHNAEIAYKNKMMELVDVPGLEESKHQFALNYALESSKLDFEKEMSQREFGESQRQFEINNELNQRKFLLDQNAQQFQQTVQMGQLALDEASVTGFYQNKPTMARVQFDEQTRQFNATHELQQAQTVLNAPRGVADFAGYINRLTGLKNQGVALPGAVNAILRGSQVGTTGAMQGAMPMTNSQFANALVYGQNNLNAQRTPDPNAQPVQNNTAQPLAQAIQPGSAPMFSSAAGGNAGMVQGQGGQVDMTGMQAGGNGMIRSGADVNFRDWEKLSPITQQYTTGYAEENLGQPAEDFVWGIAQGAPGMQSSQQAKRGMF